MSDNFIQMGFLKRLHNKYFYAALAFVIWILFFDRNSLIFRYKNIKELKDVKRQREFYMREIKKDSESIDELLTDSATLEKFAREKYLMKKDNEDIYVIKKKKNE